MQPLWKMVLRFFKKKKLGINPPYDPAIPLLGIYPEENKTSVRYHLAPVRMAIIKKSTNNKCWRGCGGKVTLLHCWWECKLIEPLWKTVWRFLNKLGIRPPYPTPRHIP